MIIDILEAPRYAAATEEDDIAASSAEFVQTLRALSLVSKKFVDLAQERLFKDIVLQTEYFGLEGPQAEEPETPGFDGFEAFGTLVQKKPHLAAYTRRLTPRMLRHMLCKVNDDLVSTDALDGLRKLKALTHLTLEFGPFYGFNMAMHHAENKFGEALLSYLKLAPIHTLVLKNVFMSADVLVRCQMLRSIEFYHPGFRWWFNRAEVDPWGNKWKEAPKSIPLSSAFVENLTIDKDSLVKFHFRGKGRPGDHCFKDLPFKLTKLNTLNIAVNPNDRARRPGLIPFIIAHTEGTR